MMKWAFLHLVFLVTFNCHAITFEDAIFPELVTSGRALAMGNAFIAKADDASAAFYNPAGLGTVRYPHLHLSNFAIETSKGTLGAMTAGQFTNSFSNMTKPLSLEGLRTLLNNNVGTIGHLRLHALPNFTSRYFSMGYLIAKRTRATVTSTTSATGFEVADRFDMGPYAAMNFSLFGGIFKFGASGIVLYRKEYSGNIDPTLSTSSLNYNKGTAAIVTGGFKMTLPIAFLPTLAINAHNMLDKHFSSAGAGAPTSIPRSYDVGFSVTPQIGAQSRFHFEVNYKDISGAYSGVSSTRRILIGAEMDFSRVFYFRLGYGDGFGSGGIGVRTQKVEFDLTTYAVDTTSSSFRGKEDRRFVLGMSTGI